MHQPNTTYDAYIAPNAPPAAPDVSQGQAGMRSYFWCGMQINHPDDSIFFFDSIADVPVADDDRDDWPAPPSTGTFYVPDHTGQGYRIVFVEYHRSPPSPAPFKRLFLQRMAQKIGRGTNFGPIHLIVDGWASFLWNSAFPPSFEWGKLVVSGWSRVQTPNFAFGKLIVRGLSAINWSSASSGASLWGKLLAHGVSSITGSSSGTPSAPGMLGRIIVRGLSAITGTSSGTPAAPAALGKLIAWGLSALVWNSKAAGGFQWGEAIVNGTSSSTTTAGINTNCCAASNTTPQTLNCTVNTAPCGNFKSTTWQLTYNSSTLQWEHTFGGTGSESGKVMNFSCQKTAGVHGIYEWELRGSVFAANQFLGTITSCNPFNTGLITIAVNSSVCAGTPNLKFTITQ